MTTLKPSGVVVLAGALCLLLAGAQLWHSLSAFTGMRAHSASSLPIATGESSNPERSSLNYDLALTPWKDLTSIPNPYFSQLRLDELFVRNVSEIISTSYSQLTASCTAQSSAFSELYPNDCFLASEVLYDLYRRLLRMSTAPFLLVDIDLDPGNNWLSFYGTTLGHSTLAFVPPDELETRRMALLRVQRCVQLLANRSPSIRNEMDAFAADDVDQVHKAVGSESWIYMLRISPHGHERSVVRQLQRLMTDRIVTYAIVRVARHQLHDSRDDVFAVVHHLLASGFRLSVLTSDTTGLEPNTPVSEENIDDLYSELERRSPHSHGANAPVLYLFATHGYDLAIPDFRWYLVGPPPLVNNMEWEDYQKGLSGKGGRRPLEMSWRYRRCPDAGFEIEVIRKAMFTIRCPPQKMLRQGKYTTSFANGWHFFHPNSVKAGKSLNGSNFVCVQAQCCDIQPGDSEENPQCEDTAGGIFTERCAIVHQPKRSVVTRSSQATIDPRGKFSLPSPLRQQTSATAGDRATPRHRPVNILTLLVDGCSRAMYNRSFPALQMFLRSEHFRRFADHVDFTNVRSVGRNSGPNTAAMYSDTPSLMGGVRGFEMGATDSREWIWQRLRREHGYATAIVNDMCSKHDALRAGSRDRAADSSGDGESGVEGEVVPSESEDPGTEDTESVRRRVLQSDVSESDYYLNAMFCHPGRRRPHCFGDRYVPEYVFEYVREFIRAHQHMPWAAFVTLAEAHEDSQSLAGVLDDLLVQFLSAAYSSGALENTVVLLVSDHGLHYGSHFQTPQGISEHRQPMLHVLLSRDLQIGEDEQMHLVRTLSANRHRLVTHYDTYRSLRQLIDHTAGIRSPEPTDGPLSYFHDAIPPQRTCVDAFGTRIHMDSKVTHGLPDALYHCVQLSSETGQATSAHPLVSIERSPSLPSFYSDARNGVDDSGCGHPAGGAAAFRVEVDGTDLRVRGTCDTTPSAVPVYSLVYHPTASHGVDVVAAVPTSDGTAAVTLTRNTSLVAGVFVSCVSAEEATSPSAFVSSDVELHLLPESPLRSTPEPTGNSAPMEILILSLDSVTSRHAQRHLSETFQMLTGSLSHSSAVLRKYSAVGLNSIPNQVALMTGCVAHDVGGESYFVEPRLLWSMAARRQLFELAKHRPETMPAYQLLCAGNRSVAVDDVWLPALLRKRGFDTMFGEEICGRTSGWSMRPFIEDEWLTHEFGVHACHSIVGHKYMQTDRDPRHCVYGRHPHEIFFSHYLQYRQRPRSMFSYVDLGIGHMRGAIADRGDRLRYIDADLARFVQSLASDGERDVVLVLVSDHGPAGGHDGITYTPAGQAEHRNPLLSVVFSKHLMQSPRGAAAMSRIRGNADALVTPHDLYTFVRSMAVEDTGDVKTFRHPWAQNPGTQRLSPQRTCADAMVPDAYCPLHTSTPFSRTPCAYSHVPHLFRLNSDYDAEYPEWQAMFVDACGALPDVRRGRVTLPRP